jgi:hypothetical protein
MNDIISIITKINLINPDIKVADVIHRNCFGGATKHQGNLLINSEDIAPQHLFELFSSSKLVEWVDLDFQASPRCVEVIISLVAARA